MGRKCNVEGCCSDSNRLEDAGVTFHKVPTHTDIRPKWFTLCRIPSEKKTQKTIYVCSRHFLRADFCNFKGRKYMLRQGVLPSVFPWDKSKLDCIKPKKPDEENDEEKPVEKVKDEPSTSEPSTSEPPVEPPQENPTPIKTEEIDIKEEPQPVPEMEIPPEEPKPEDSIKLEDVKTEVKEETTEPKIAESKVIQTPSGTLNFVINSRIEVLDFNNSWYPARIVEVDYEENEVLIHFEKFSSKYDEWICMDSARLRPVQPLKKPVTCEQYVVGERCLATWSDSRKFPATVTKVMDNDTYEVLFDDGFIKTQKAHRMSKAQGKSLQSSPLFDPVKGTKQERRDKKRKINVAALFGKRPRSELADEKPPVSPVLSPASEEGHSRLQLRWSDGKPVGMDSYIEMNDSKKKSIEVDDPRLPAGWKKHFVQRTMGNSAGKWYCIIVSSDNRKFRNRAEIRAYIETHPDLEYSESMFDFSTGNRSRRRKLPLPESRKISLSSEPIKEPELPEPIPTEDNHEEDESINSLKIPLVDDAYKCPIEGCGKNFRRENLAQMHVKHYHPEYTKYLDSTPNVADLAYARTVGENLDKSPTPAKPSPIRQPAKLPIQKTGKLPQSPLVDIDTKPLSPAPSTKTKDAEIIKLLNSKPFDKQQEIESIQPLPSGLPSNMYPDIKLRDLLSKAEAVPKRDDLNLKSLCASRPPVGIKTLLPVVRAAESKYEDSHVQARVNFKRKRMTSENYEYKGNDFNSPPPPPYDTSASLQPPILSHETPPLLPPASNNIIIEGGEVIKIVRMKQEEIINCTCGFTEEDGLMIQCELCLCWQHAYCNNIERESQVPEKYVCYICQNPVRERTSKKYFHDQDWLKQGVLPSGSYHSKDEELLQKRFEKLKKAHDVSGGLLELREYVHNLSIKLKIAEAKNHPKLYLWFKPWEKLPLPEKANLKQEEEIKPKLGNEPDTLKTEPDSMLMMMLKNDKDPKLDLGNLMDNNVSSAPIIPKPEAAIDLADCKLNLLEHIAHSQNLVEERMDDFEKIIDTIEEGLDIEADQNYPRVRTTIQMLLRDLGTLRDLSQVL